MNRPKQYQQHTAATYYKLSLKQIDDHNFGLALGNLLLVAKLDPEKASELQRLVAGCLGNAAQSLKEGGRHEELLKIYESVLEVYPDCGIIINSLGEYLFRHGHVLQAAAQFLRATRADPNLITARDSLERANSRLVDRWHFTMLNDARRNAAYERAVRAAVGRMREGEVVLDLGAGTALLSMMAARAGASPVIACESSEAMCLAAAATLADNGMQQSVQLVNKWSHELVVGEDLPARVSLLVTETFDAGLLGEHVLASLQHAWRHLMLPPGRGRVLPGSAVIWAAPVESEDLRAQLSGRLPNGTRLRRRLSEPYWSERLADLPEGYRLLADPVQVYEVDFNSPESIERGLSGIEASHVIQCTTVGQLDAVVTWFELRLGDGETLTSAPGEDTCWEQAVYPVMGERNVRMGEGLVVTSVCKGHLELRVEEDARMEVANGNAKSGASGESGKSGSSAMDTSPPVPSNRDTEATEMRRDAGEAKTRTAPTSGTVAASAAAAAVSENATLAEADVSHPAEAEEVSAEALAFATDRPLLDHLETSLRRWLGDRPASSSSAAAAGPVRVLDLCPFPLARLMDLSDLNVTRRDDSTATAAARSTTAAEKRPVAAAGSVVERPADSESVERPGAGAENDKKAEEKEEGERCWDVVLAAPVLPSGRLDPAVMRELQSAPLAEGGLLWPPRLELVAVAVSSPLLLRMGSVRPENTQEFDCSAVNVFTVSQLQDFPYSHRAASSDLSGIHIISHLDIRTGSLDPVRFSIPVTSSGEMHGLVYWFWPVDGSDDAVRPVGGRQMAVLLPVPRTVRDGDRVMGSVHPTADGVFVALDQ